jgi:hypothetical protein
LELQCTSILYATVATREGGKVQEASENPAEMYAIDGAVAKQLIFRFG